MLKMHFSSILSDILLGCTVLSIMLSFALAMDCTTIEDEQVCLRSCQEKGYRYGMCDYSDCSCYGRTRRPNGASLMLGNGPADGSKFARQLPALLERRIQTVAPATTKRPLKCTSAAKTGRNEAESSSYETCLSWCRESHLDIYASLDNLCCCQKK